MKGEARARDGLGPNMDSTTSDTDDSYYVGELIRKQSITAMSVFGAARQRKHVKRIPPTLPILTQLLQPSVKTTQETRRQMK